MLRMMHFFVFCFSMTYKIFFDRRKYIANHDSDHKWNDFVVFVDFRISWNNRSTKLTLNFKYFCSFFSYSTFWFGKMSRIMWRTFPQFANEFDFDFRIKADLSWHTKLSRQKMRRNFKMWKRRKELIKFGRLKIHRTILHAKYSSRFERSSP